MSARARPARLLARFDGSRRAARPTAGVHGRGLLLSQCRTGAAVHWARRGIGAVTVAPLDGWTVVVPTGPAAARHPYDDAVRSLAGRPVAASMRPALGVFHVGRQVVLTVHLRPGAGRTAGAGRFGGVAPGVRGLLDAWRPRQGWLIWTPREGLVPPDGLPAADLDDVLAAAARVPAGPGSAVEGAAEGAVADDPAQTRAALARVLADGTLEPGAVLTEIFGILSLPGIDLLRDGAAVADLPGAREVRPSPRAARAFERVVAEENRHLDEMEL